MFVAITNAPRDYSWGSQGVISALLGREASGAPEAELWLGAHPGSPSQIVDPTITSGATTLTEWIERDPSRALGGHGTRLPFLLKVLAAEAPLSLQAHPTHEQARAGFARENAAGIPVDASTRNYRDPYPKPELIYALSETFEALCGFRSVDDVRETVALLMRLDSSTPGSVPELFGVWLAHLLTRQDLRSSFEWLISRGDGVDALVARVVELAAVHPQELPGISELAHAYPGDPGIVISLMVHRVTLARGEALFLPAGNIHAYLRGVGIELMTASDNVLRGGLTPKHIDVPELISVLDFTASPVPYLEGEQVSESVTVFHPPGEEFALFRIVNSGTITPSGPSIAICVDGDLELVGESSAFMSRGESNYITPDEGAITISGTGTIFVATTTR